MEERGCSAMAGPKDPGAHNLLPPNQKRTAERTTNDEQRTKVFERVVALLGHLELPRESNDLNAGVRREEATRKAEKRAEGSRDDDDTNGRERAPSEARPMLPPHLRRSPARHSADLFSLSRPLSGSLSRVSPCLFAQNSIQR
jgi:hypothetical protein